MKSNSRAITTYKYLIAACVLSLTISTFASYFFYLKWNEAEDHSMEVSNEKKILEQDFSWMKNSFDKIFTDLIVIRDENARVTTLRSADSTKRFSARVYWNHYTRSAFIDVLALPVPDSTEQYHLWALDGGRPVDAGVFNVEPEPGIQRMKPMTNADGWIVTLEPKGSNASPTPGRVYLVTKN